MSTNIKICGITSLVDALAALDAGADYLGLIFAEGSPRRVEEAAAQEIISGVEGRAKIVGVFKDQEFDVVASVAERLSLDFVQCHGAESIDYVRKMPTRVIRTIELNDNAEEAELAINRWKDKAAILLFDRPKSIADAGWYQRAVEQLIAVKPQKVAFFFAGGLTAANVEEVIAALDPFGVDVASSVESTPGKKDIGKMNDFCNAVKQAIFAEQ